MKSFLLFLMTVFLSVSAYSQEKRVELVHKRRNKVEIINRNSPVVLFTTSKEKIKGNLVDFNETNLIIRHREEVEFAIKIQDIYKIKIDRFEDTRWLEPFSYMLIGAGFTLVAIPFIWIFDGGKQASDGLEFAGTLASVSSTAILIGKSRKSFNLKTNWSLIVRTE